MRNTFISSVISSAVAIALLAGSAAGRPLTHPSAAPPFDRDSEWNEITALYNAGLRVIEEMGRPGADRPGLSDERRRIFMQAAEKLDRWVKTYVQDVGSDVYARNVYRLGNYWEYAYEFDKAKSAYLTCANHPRVGTAVLGDAPLSAQLPARLAEVEKNQGTEYAGRGKLKRRKRKQERGAIVKIRKAGSPVERLFSKILGLGDSGTETVEDDTVPPEKITDPLP